MSVFNYPISVSEKVMPMDAADYVSCDTCKCLLRKEDAQKVELAFCSSSDLYYCRVHEKPYTKVSLPWTPGDPVRYSARVEVEQDGTPVGYVKAKPKKKV